MQGQSRSSSSPQVVGRVASVMAPSMPVTSAQRRAAANPINRSGFPNFEANSSSRLGLLAALCRRMRGPSVSAAGLLSPAHGQRWALRT